MEVVARDPKDSLQHLVQIKGGEDGLARIVQNCDFCHSKGILSSGTAVTEVPKVTIFFGHNNAFLIAISPISTFEPCGSGRRRTDKTRNPAPSLNQTARADAGPRVGAKAPSGNRQHFPTLRRAMPGRGLPAPDSPVIDGLDTIAALPGCRVPATAVLSC